MNTTSGFTICLWIPPQDSQYVYEYHLRISNMLMNTTSGFAICLWIPPQDSQYVCEYHLRLVMRKHQKKSKDLTAARIWPQLGARRKMKSAWNPILFCSLVFVQTVDDAWIRTQDCMFLGSNHNLCTLWPLFLLNNYSSPPHFLCVWPWLTLYPSCPPACRVKLTLALLWPQI